ncbi:MAG: hypothetical protein BAJALOKI2v1_290031 [Promethearchaeota archaeon]|nr:MAG: hypothetical protein BAJALOKI2v1_290031 [Candidatus Lokiarchaeota archaeon]
MVDLYINVYRFRYLYPWVFKDVLFKSALSDKNQYWLVIEPLDANVILGAGLFHKINNRTIFASKLVCKKEYQGKGLAGILGTRGVRALYQKDAFEGILRLETDVRAKTYPAQRVLEAVGCRPYAYIPNYNNYADKRSFDPSKGEPFIKGEIEPGIMYFKPFKGFWNKRKSPIFLFDEEEILLAYDIVKKTNKKNMKSDRIIIKDGSNKSHRNQIHNYSKDYYKAILSFTGYVKNIKKILDSYSKWNLIEWRIPTNSEKSIYYQKLAIENGFHVVGYDPFAIHQKISSDAIIFTYYPNGIEQSQFTDIRFTRRSKPLCNLINPLIDT